MTPSRLRALRLAIIATALGVLVSLMLLVQQTPYTLAAFMFVGQPLLVLGGILFAWHVVRDLRRAGLF